MRKNTFKKLTALLLVLMLVLSSVPITASAAEVQLTGNDHDGYSVNMPKTGTDTLDLSDRTAGFTFNVYDDGGPETDYSSNCDGYLQITVRSGCLIQISGSGNAENTSYDWLSIYDGSDNSAPTLGGDENGKYSGRPFTVSPQLSSGNVITLWFRSDYSATFNGFALDVTVIDLSTYAFVAYSYAGTTRRLPTKKGTEIALPEFSSMFTAPEGSTFLSWQCGETQYNENDPFTVTEDVTFTASVEEPPVVFGDDETGWYANMPVTGTVNADLSDRSNSFTLHVYDNGGADANYSNNCTGTMRIIAASDCVLRFSGSGSSESGYDYLRLYDGDTDTVIGSQKNDGTFTIDTAMTSGNVLKIYFYSDSSKTLSGFDLTVTVVKRSSLAILTFNAGDGTGTMDPISVIPVENVTVPACTFTPPQNKLFSHYTDGENNYHPDDVIPLSANKTLTAVYADKVTATYVYGENTQTAEFAQGAQIQLPTFLSMFTLPERKHFSGWQCGETVYNEGDTFTLTGDTSFTALVEDDPVILHGEAGTSYANYENYSLLPKNTSVTADLTGESEGYVLWVFDNGGVNGNYSNDCNGSLTVLVPEGCIMQITSDVSTELSCDYLYVYDGNSTSADEIGKFSGNAGTGILYSTANAVTVRFYSDGRKNLRGIDMKITVTKPSSLLTVSFDPGEGSGTMNDLKFLPGDRFSVPDSTFTPPEKTYFDYFTDGTNKYRRNDYLYITEDLQLTAVYIEKISIIYQDHNGKTWTQYKRKGERFYLADYETAGFSLPYRKTLKQWRNENDEAYAPLSLFTANADTTFTPEFENLPYLIDDDNGGYYALMPVREQIDDFDLSDRQNGFTFKLYDNGGQNTYATNCDGSLTLTAPEGHVFRFSGEGMTEENRDLLYIYDSDGTTLLGGNAYSGSFTMTDLQTTSNTLTVKFTSDSANCQAGFVLNVMVVDPSTLITVSFDAGEGESTMDSITAISGTAITLPDYGFTAPESKIFSGYSDGTHTYWPGNSVTFNADTTLTAQWAAATGFTYTCKNQSRAIRYPLGSTVSLPELTDIFDMPAGMHFTGWKEKFSGTIYQSGDEYVANAPTVFTAQLEILYSDGEDGYYALMPLWNVNDPLLLDLSDKSSGFTFTLYDEGGKEGNHTDDNNADIVVKAPENMVVTVSGIVVLERNCDYLRFYNGANDRSPVLGDNKYYGNNVAVGPLMTDGNYLTIYFHSDSSANNAGFELTITVVAMTSVTYEFDGATEVVAAQKNSTIELAEFSDLFDSDTKEFICWQNGEDTYDEGDEFVVTGDVTFTAVTRLMPTATFDGSGATVIGSNGETVTPPIPFPTGTTDQLPHANMIFNIPEGKCFGGWSYNNRTYAVGEEFTITEDVTFTAIWRDPNAWDILGEFLNAAPGTNLGTITLTEDIAADIGSLPLTVPAGVTVTINLNGHTLDGTNAAAMGNGSIIFVYGDLTLTNSGENAAVTGGGVQVFSNAAFDPAAVEANFGAKLLMTYDYDNDDTNQEFENQLYAAVWYPTLYNAFTAAATIPKDFKDNLELPANNSFWYNDYKVVLLADTTIPEGETWTVSSDDSIWFDLNGHTFDIQGTLTGGIQGWQYQNGYIPTFYPTNIRIVSTTPGTFRSSGTIGVGIQPWTEDTYYITGGTVSGEFFADGGTFYISGGHFTGLVMFNNGNDDADLEIHLSGNAEFDRLEHMIYADEGASHIHMTIGDNVRIRAILFDIMNGTVTYPVLTVNGGYFTVDPRTWLETANGDENVVQIPAVPEQYSDQTDWAADSDTYTWRVKQAFTGHSLSLNGDIGVNFYIDLTEEQAADATVTFTWTAGGVDNTATVELKDAEHFDCGCKATCNIAPAEMTRPITATLTVGGVFRAKNIYSAKQYAEVILTSESFADYYIQLENKKGNNGEERLEQLRTLVTNMLHYGAATQAQFDIDAQNPADEGLTALAYIGADDIHVTDTDMTADLTEYGLTYTGSTLVCRTTALLRHYYRVDDQEKFNLVKDGITIKGEPVEFKSRNGEIYFEIRNISAAELDADQTLKIGTNEYKYSAMDYAKRALRASEQGSTLWNLATALYWYNQAANIYFV